MVARNFSQLAVVADDGTFHGAVSWESIGRANIGTANATLKKSTVHVPLVDYDEPLLDHIEQIYDRGFLFVRSADKSRLNGIITTADLTGLFGELARPFVLFEEIELRLRRRVDDVFTLDEIRMHAKKKPEYVKSAKALTLGNYWYLFEPEERWRRLRWNVDRRLFLELLKTVSRMRNDTMHFSPDPLTKEKLDQISGFLGLLRAVDPNP